MTDPEPIRLRDVGHNSGNELLMPYTAQTNVRVKRRKPRGRLYLLPIEWEPKPRPERPPWVDDPRF
jgi:hypothetical protein